MKKEIKISPSQIAKYRRCPRIIGYEYVEGKFAPSSPKQQFGTDVHEHLEKWLSQGIVPDNSSEGQVAKQGIQGGWLPVPDKKLLVEHKFSFFWNEKENIKCGGIVDCGHPGIPLVLDHKTTSDLRWAMSPEELRVDAQGIIYSLWAMLEWGVKKVTARWVYYSASNPKSGNRKPRGAKPVEAVFDADSAHFRLQVDNIGRDIAAIVHIRRSGIPGKELPPNPASCQMYGGCFHAGLCDLQPADRLAGFIEKAEVYSGNK